MAEKALEEISALGPPADPVSSRDEGASTSGRFSESLPMHIQAFQGKEGRDLFKKRTHCEKVFIFVKITDTQLIRGQAQYEREVKAFKAHILHSPHGQQSSASLKSSSSRGSSIQSGGPKAQSRQHIARGRAARRLQLDTNIARRLRQT